MLHQTLCEIGPLIGPNLVLLRGIRAPYLLLLGYLEIHTRWGCYWTHQCIFNISTIRYELFLFDVRRMAVQGWCTTKLKFVSLLLMVTFGLLSLSNTLVQDLFTFVHFLIWNFTFIVLYSTCCFINISKNIVLSLAWSITMCWGSPTSLPQDKPYLVHWYKAHLVTG